MDSRLLHGLIQIRRWHIAIVGNNPMLASFSLISVIPIEVNAWRPSALHVHLSKARMPAKLAKFRTRLVIVSGR